MSWEDKLNNIPFTIVTGDGKKYTPLWISGETSVEFNVKKHEFINVEGSLIDRKKAKANKFPLLFYFQGEKNIEQSKAFYKSASDNRTWEVSHPFYGTIIGQPLSLGRDDSSFNATKFVVDFWETITEDYPKNKISTRDVISQKVKEVNLLGISNYTSGAKPKSADISKIKENSINTGAKYKRIQTQATYNNYKKAISKAVKSTDLLIASPSAVIANNQDLIMMPSTYDVPVLRRINAAYLAYLEVRAVITGKNDKYYFESHAATIIASIAQAAVSPAAEDYITKGQVNEVSGFIQNIYNNYIESVDANQIDRYDIENEWSPNPNLQQALYDLVTNTLGNLYTVAFSAKQERTVEVQEDTNLFLLAHRYMGLDEKDNNLETFRIINNIRNEELFKIKKGRIIKYYVS